MKQHWSLLLLSILVISCSKSPVAAEENVVSEGSTIVVSDTQPMQNNYGTGDQATYDALTSGITVSFQMDGITSLVLESVDGYAIAGTAQIEKDGSVLKAGNISNAESIITFTQDIIPGHEYTIVTFPCDLYGGYRLSIYKDGQVAHYFGVHQSAEAGKCISPSDLNESELEFDDPDAPLVEEERPELNAATKEALRIYKLNPTEENKHALLEQM